MRLKTKLKRWWRLYKWRPEIYTMVFFIVNTVIRIVNYQWILALHNIIFVTCIFTIFQLSLRIERLHRIYKIILHRATRKAFMDGIDYSIKVMKELTLSLNDNNN